MKVSRIHFVDTGNSKHGAGQSHQGWGCLRSVFRDSPEGICVTDHLMRVVVWNRTAAEITGCGASEVLGRPCRIEGNDLKLDPSSRAKGLIVGGAHARGQSSTCSFHIRNKSGDRTWLTTVIPLHHNELGFVFHILRSLPGPTEVPHHSIDALTNRYSAQQRGDGSGRNGETSLPALTRREQEILRLLASGKTAKPIATEMSLSVATVRTHIQNILRKLKVHSCLEAAVWLLSRPAELFQGENLLNFR